MGVPKSNCLKKVNPQVEYDAVAFCSECDADATYAWSLTIVLSQADDVNELKDGNHDSSVDDKHKKCNLVIKPNVMLEGREYTLTLTINTGGLSASKKLTLFTNMRPYEGKCLVDPSSGMTLTNNLHFTLAGSP